MSPATLQNTAEFITHVIGMTGSRQILSLRNLEFQTKLSIPPSNSNTIGQ